MMNPMQMMNKFPQFMQQMRGKNPNQMLNELLSSGKVNQDQINQAQKMADQMGGRLNQFKSMFGFNK
jgi:hypothetical protein